MRVLHIGKFYPPFHGGIEKVNFDCVESLNKAGIKTDVLCFNHKKGDSIEEKDYVIYRCTTLVSAFSTPISLSFFKTLKKIHKNYDIIHIHLPNPLAAIPLQLTNFKGKLIIHWHSDIVKQKVLKIIYNPFQKKILQRADKIIVTSPNYLEGSEDLRPFKNKCVVIPIGISKSDFIEDLSFEVALKEKYNGKKIVLSIGRLVYYKGFEFLIEAARMLDDNTVVLIGGIGPLQLELEKLIEQNNLKHKVKLIGRIEENQMAAYFNIASVFCLASHERSEAFGVVLIEALSFSKALVTTQIPGSGVPWVNQHDETGLVVSPKSADELADALIKILSDTAIRKKFELNAKERFEQEFTQKKMSEKLRTLYERVTKN